MKKLIIENISLHELKSLIEEALQTAIGSNKPEEEFLNIQEASSFTKIPITTIYDYTSNQKIPFHKKGKKLFFVKQELSLWLKTAQTSEGGAPWVKPLKDRKTRRPAGESRPELRKEK